MSAESLRLTAPRELIEAMRDKSVEVGLTQNTFIRVAVERLIADLNEGRVEMRDVPILTGKNGWLSAVNALRAQQAQRGEKQNTPNDARMADMHGKPLRVTLPVFQELQGKDIPIAASRDRTEP